MTTTKQADKKKTEEHRYWEGVGRRKTAVARVRVYEKGKGIAVNDKEYHEYFPQESLQLVVMEALRVANHETMHITAHVFGGGSHAQAHALRHGIARALTAYNEDLRKILRDAGYLTRDPRMKERRKFGLRKARRAPQWSKR